MRHQRINLHKNKRAPHPNLASRTTSFMDRRDVCPKNWPSFQQKQRKRHGQAARQNCAPRSDERGSDPALQDLWGFLCPNAMAFRKSAVSWDQRPPTFAAKTTKRALPPSPVSSGWFPSPYELPAKPHRSWWLRAVVQCSRHARVTPEWCLRPTVPDDDLNAPSIQWVENSNI